MAETIVIGNKTRNEPNGISSKLGLLTERLAIMITGNDRGRISSGNKGEEFNPKVKAEHKSANSEILIVTKNDIRKNNGNEAKEISKNKEAMGIANRVTSISMRANAKYLAAKINSKETPII